MSAPETADIDPDRLTIAVVPRDAEQIGKVAAWMKERARARDLPTDGFDSPTADP